MMEYRIGSGFSWVLGGEDDDDDDVIGVMNYGSIDRNGFWC